MKILIVKPSSLGDIVHALPAVCLVRQRFPEATISWLVNDNFAGILELFPGIDEIVVFQRQRLGRLAGVAELCRFLLALRRRQFDLVIDFQGLFRSGFMAFATGARRRIGFENAREGAAKFYTEAIHLPANLEHAVDKNLFLVQAAFKIPGTCGFPDLSHRQEFVHRAEGLLAQEGIPAGAAIVAVAPAARWPSKTWPPGFFAEVIQQVHAQAPGTVFWILGTKAEQAAGARLARLCAGLPVHDLTGKTDLGTLVELLGRSRVLLTNDSGPMHIGAMLKRPCIALFGPTSPEKTGPYGDGHRIFSGPCDLRPCFQRQCPKKAESCQILDVAEVAAAVASHLPPSAAASTPRPAP